MSDDLRRLTAYPSIYEFLSARADETGRLPVDVTLPDEAPAKPGTVTWAAGAFDGIFGHHSSGGENDSEAQRLAELIGAPGRSLAGGDGDRAGTGQARHRTARCRRCR